MVLLQWHKQAQVARQNESLVVAFSQERWIELRPKNKHSRFCRPAKNGSIAHWLLQPLQQYFFVGAAGTAPKPDGAAVVVVALFEKEQHGGVVEVGVGFDAGQAETAGMVFNKIEEKVRQALANPGIGQSYAVHHQKVAPGKPAALESGVFGLVVDFKRAIGHHLILVQHNIATSPGQVPAYNFGIGITVLPLCAAICFAPGNGLLQDGPNGRRLGGDCRSENKILACVLLTHRTNSGLIGKAAPAQKLPQNGGGWNFPGLHGFEIIEEFQKPVGLGVFGLVGLDFEQNGFGIGLEYGKFVQQGGIEHYIGFFLIRKNVLLLAPAHTGPATDGVAGGVFAVFVIAHNASYEPVVGSGDAREVVHVYTGQGRHIHLEFGFVGYRGGQFGVQSVNALYNKDVVLLHFKGFAIVETGARLEGELGNLDFLAGQKLTKMGVQQIQIQGFERLKIKFPMLVLRGMVAVHKVIVERQVKGFDASYQQLNGQAFAKGGFAAGGGTADEHHTEFVAPIGDAIGNVGNFLFVQGFGDFHQGVGTTVTGGFVEVADFGHP